MLIERKRSDTILVLHYTAANSLSSRNTFKNASKVSVHYMIDCDGTVLSYQNKEEHKCQALVPLDKVAWHAGVSYWRNLSNINDYSIGIECVNLGNSERNFSNTCYTKLDASLYPRVSCYWDPFPNAQYLSLLNLCRDVTSKFAIHPWNIVAHADISVGRKLDPGPFFPFDKLASNGIGLWPKNTNRYLQEAEKLLKNHLDAQSYVIGALHKIGYGVYREDWSYYIHGNQKNNIKVFPSYKTDEYFFKCAVVAFKMHYLSREYRNNTLDASIDTQLVTALMSLLSEYNI